MIYHAQQEARVIPHNYHAKEILAEIIGNIICCNTLDSTTLDNAPHMGFKIFHSAWLGSNSTGREKC